MKEHMIMTSELTARAAYPTLDRAHSLRNVYIAMDKGNNEQPPKTPVIEAKASFVPKSLPLDKPLPDSFLDLVRSSSPAVGKRIVEDMINEARDTGKALTSEQRKLIMDLGYEPIIAGGADVPENEGWNPEDAPSEPSREEVNHPSNERRPDREETTEGRGRRRGRERGGNDPAEYNIAPSGITQPVFNTFINEWNQINGALSADVLVPQLYSKAEELHNIVNTFTDEAQSDAFEAERKKIQEEVNKQLPKASAKGERLGLYLQDDDRQQLMTQPLKWLDSKFNLIYGAAESGQELESQVMSSVQSLVGEATQFLSRRFEKAFEAGDRVERERYKNFIDIFNRQFSTTINALQTRTVIDRRLGMEQVAGVYGRLGAQGLLGALSFDEGRVGAMYYRMDDLLETIRLADGGKTFHVYASMVSNLQLGLEDEQFELAKKGVGVFADVYKKLQLQGGDVDDALRAEILRDIRLAYNIHVSSQRQALISSRGGHDLNSTDSIYSDPGGGFSFFNIEDFSIEKYKILNQEQRAYMEYVQMDMALNEDYKDPSEKGNLTTEELKLRGKRLFRDLSIAPDFYSSGWRVKGMLQQIENVTRYKLENEAIVKDLLSKNTSFPEVRKKFEEYLEARRKSSEWYVQTTNTDGTPIPGGQEKALQKIAWEFARGVAPYDTGGIIVPKGLTLEDRIAYKKAFRSTFESAEFNEKVKKRAADMGLFLRLRNPGVSSEVALGNNYDKKDPKAETREGVWERVAKYRPEEIMKIVRERMDITDTQGNKDRRDQAVLRSMNKIFEDAGVGKNYDEFKKKYGAVIRSIREDAMNEGAGRQLDLRQLTKNQDYAEYRGKIDKMFGAGSAAKIQEAYDQMYKFIHKDDLGDENLIFRLSNSWRYEDLYNRTIDVNDAMLHQLEYTPENSGITRLSQFWTNERGADALQRNGNDFKNNEKAAGAQIGGLTAERDEQKLKAAEEQHGATAGYGGPGPASRAFRYSYGSYMRFALQDHWADVLNIGKLPFRMSSSELERVFGPGEKPLTAEAARAKLDHLRGFLTGRDDHNPHNAEKYYLELEKALRADLGSLFKDKSVGIGFYILLALILVPLATSAKVVSEASK